MVVIDAGHGGTDYGGGSNDSWLEKDLVLKISNYQFNRFKSLGIPVKMTRYTDTYVSPNNRIEKAINAFGKNSDVILISNHINKSESGFSGAELIYSINSERTLVDLLAKELKNAGQSINRIYTRRNSAGNDYYYIIRGTTPINSVIVEYGFADSEKDTAFLNSNWQALAEAVVKGVCEFLGYPYVKESDYYYYTVVKGDTLYDISKKTYVSVEDIKKFNNLVSNLITPGEILKIPYMRSSTYTTRNDETLFEIAKKMRLTPLELINQYNIFEIKLKENQIIKVKH